MFHVDWKGPLTRGRPVFRGVMTGRAEDAEVIRGVNYSGGFPCGWDRWSDGQPTFDLRDVLRRGSEELEHARLRLRTMAEIRQLYASDFTIPIPALDS